MLNGMKIAVRYPDRIPAGMGISKSALKAKDLQEENPRLVFLVPLKPERKFASSLYQCWLYAQYNKKNNFLVSAVTFFFFKSGLA